MTNVGKSSLSKNVLQMKFMQRSALQIEKEKTEEEKQKVIDDEHWVLDLPETEQKECKYIIEGNIAHIENLQFGRFSFNGCNPEVEKLMKIHNTERELEEAAAREAQNSVNDQEMAQRYKSLSQTIAKKFAKKRKRAEIDESFDKESSHVTVDEETLKKGKKKSSKRKFLKPKDD
ncbi:M-phase phosphoprotein 6-like [Saccostrea echinata]|uniref:M-phase phosphoprotein 6-like n=1 Tax=Saccostrea echinata TaxID=191078 RepID=UPI002A7FD396|nr:M-phase phosphoprotein 6-like [Saccostrea echinata]